MLSHVPARTILFLVGLAPTLAHAGAAPRQGHKLSGPLVMTSAGDVEEAVTTPDGSRVVYRADQDVNDKYELYSTSPDGSQPVVRLSGSMADDRNVTDFTISPDGASVVFLADRSAHRVYELWVVPIDGSAAPVRLHPALPADRDVRAYFRVTPDGSRVVYRADLGVDETVELLSVPIDASASPVSLSGPLVTGGDVRAGFQITPAGRVIYRADKETDQVIELYSVPADGSAAAVKLNAELLPNNLVNGFEVDAGGAHVAYRAGADNAPVLRGYALFGVPADGSSPAVDLSSPLVTGGEVFDFSISPVGDRVVFRSDRDVDQVTEVYSVPLNGSAAPTKLNATLVTGGDVHETVTASDGMRVVYRADQDTDGVNELYAVPIDASASPTKLNDPLVAGGTVHSNVLVSPDSTRVVFRAEALTIEFIELFSVPIDGTQSPVRLNEQLIFTEIAGGNTANEGAVDEARIDSSGTRVVYLADEIESSAHQLYSVPLDGSTTRIRISGALSDGGDVLEGFLPTPDGTHVVYRADQNIDTVTELFGTPIDGSAPSVRISGTFSPGPVTLGNVRSFQLTRENERVVYLADQETDGVDELFSVDLYGGGLAKLSGPLAIGGDVTHYRLSADGEWVVYRADQEAVNRHELYAVPVDGSLAAVRLNDMLSEGTSVSEGFVLDPNGPNVVFWAHHENEGAGLYTACIDGSTTPVLLTSSVTSSLFHTPQLTPDSSRVLLSGPNAELFSVPLDASLPAVELSGPLVINGHVTSFFSAPDSTRAMYLADQEVNSRFELYSAPVDGSTPAIRLNGPLASGSVSHNHVAATLDSTRVLYSANQISEGYGLYSAPIDGAAPATMIAGPYDGSFFWLALAPDGTTALFIASATSADQRELYRVPVDGSSAPVKLSGILGPDQDVDDFLIGPRGERVVYLADADREGLLDLYSTSMSGGTPVQLSSYSGGTFGIGEGANRNGYAITPDGQKAVFLYDDADAATNLFQVPLNGAKPPKLLTRPMPYASAAVHDFSLVPRRNAVVYRAHQDGPNDELFLSFLSRPIRRAPTIR